MSSDDQRQLIGADKALETLPLWRKAEGRDAIERRFTFKSFEAAMDFMVAGAKVAARLDHHPEWTNVYNRVDVRLTTHSAAGVTPMDLALAQALDSIA